jgi:hypothetical protein
VHSCLSLVSIVLSGGGLCDGPIPRPEESYRLWCVFECDQAKIQTLYTSCEQVGRRGKDSEFPFSVHERSRHGYMATAWNAGRTSRNRVVEVAERARRWRRNIIKAVKM